eukprot:898557_1
MEEMMIEEILPKIHPSLVQLKVCAILRILPRDNNDDESSSPSNAIDIMLLRIKPFVGKIIGGDDDEKMKSTSTALSMIIEEINGETFACAPSCVIQVSTIFQTDVITQSQVELYWKTVASDHASVIPLCPVCRYRIEPIRFGLPPVKEYQRCSIDHDVSCDNRQLLTPWTFPSYCEPCRLLQKR